MFWLIAAGAWVLLVQLSYLWSKRTARLLAQQGRWHDCYLHTVTEFDFLYNVGFNSGQSRTVAIPKFTRLFVATKEFINNTAARMDSNEVLIKEALVNPPESERHKVACARVNQVHGLYSSHIQPCQMLYVLAGLIVQPIDIINKYGARRLTAEEEQAIMWVVHQYGIGLGITDTQDTLEGWRRWQLQHERKYMQYDPANKMVVEATIKNLSVGKPAWVHGFSCKLFAFLSPLYMLAAVGIDEDPMYKVSPMLQAGLSGCLHGRKMFLRLFVPPITRWRNRISKGPLPPPGQLLFCRYHEHLPATLANGYQLESLGPKKCPALSREELLAKWSTGKYAPDDK